jgi:hypothetical protein
MQIPAIPVKQWLAEWEAVEFDAKLGRKKPQPRFFMFTMNAKHLRALCGIYRRTLQNDSARHRLFGIQRRHDEKRSEEIADYVKHGYPWPELSPSKKESGQFNDLLKPGWLPTAIVVNILEPDTVRRGEKVAKDDLITLKNSAAPVAMIEIPDASGKAGWKPKVLPPIEVIDGQHRLWAFTDGKDTPDFDLPVVAFFGLDVSWQAYLFWTINIRPKRINASLAFDLYPLMRTEDWLEKFFGHSIYRETRAQELTEALWAHSKSPWYKFINMLGEAEESGKPRPPGVSQAAWIRSLLASFVKAWESPRARIGGLFGAKMKGNSEELPWTRSQQAAFLITAGNVFHEAVKEFKGKWVTALRNEEHPGLFDAEKRDLAFYGKATLINDDMGLRGFLCVINDLCYVRAADLKLEAWDAGGAGPEPTEENITECLKSLAKQPVVKFLNAICGCLANFDWRASSAKSLTNEERLAKAAFRGTGGYKELRILLLSHLTKGKGDVKEAATEVTQQLKK